MQTVTVDSITYGSSLVAPSFFSLTVANPCATSTITPNSASNIVINVWDTAAFYPSSGAAYIDFSDSVSTLNSLPTMCAKTYSATVSTNIGGVNLSGFSLDTSSK